MDRGYHSFSRHKVRKNYHAAISAHPQFVTISSSQSGSALPLKHPSALLGIIEQSVNLFGIGFFNPLVAIYTGKYAGRGKQLDRVTVVDKLTG